MPLVHYLPQPVADPYTKELRPDLFGALVTVTDPATGTPVTGLVESDSGAPLSNPVTISPSGYTPSMAIEDGPAFVNIVSGDFTTPIWSPTGFADFLAAAKVELAAAQADVDTALAQVVAAVALVNAPADDVVNAVIADPSTDAHTTILALITSMLGGAGLDEAAIVALIDTVDSDLRLALDAVIAAAVPASVDLSTAPYVMLYADTGADRPAGATDRTVMVLGGAPEDPSPAWLTRPGDLHLIDQSGS